MFAKSAYCMGSEALTPSSKASPATDLELLKRVARKERAALADVYDRFQRPLFCYLFRLLNHKELAEDILQEVMLVIWQKAATFKGHSSPSAWIFGIAHHLAFKALRHNAGKEFLALEAASELPDENAVPEIDILKAVTAEEVAQALACLTPEHREVLQLAFYQNFSCREIAAIAGVPEGTVKSRLSYARRALKAALLRNGWEAS